MKVKEIVVGTHVLLWSIPTTTETGKPEPFPTTILSEPWEIGANIVVCRVEGKTTPIDIARLSLRFCISDQWNLFLKSCNLVEEKMPVLQRIEMKRAFYAGCGQTLLMVRDDISELPRETDMVAAMEDLLRQVTDFWETQEE